jgi:hypothetical protein
MLVYSTTLWLNGQIAPDWILNVVANWLNRKTKESLTGASLKSGKTLRMKDGSRIQTIGLTDVFPIMHAIRYTHGDKDVSGRQWLTEVGFRQGSFKSEIECSILLKTDEISARVEERVQPTVPYVVHEIIEHCSPSPRTCGLSINILDDENKVEGLGYDIENRERHYPLVLVSPNSDNKYLVDPEKLKFWLEGLAELILIPFGANTFWIEQVIGNKYAVWNGAISIIFPKSDQHNRSFIPTRRLLPEELTNMLNDGQGPEREILSIVTHRMNLPNSWCHISIESVADLFRRRERARLRQLAAETGKSAEYAAFLEELTRDQDEQIKNTQNVVNQLEIHVASLEDELRQLDDDRRQLRYENESLKDRLLNVGVTLNYELTYESLHDIFASIVGKFITPEDSLSIVKKLFPDRIEILPSGWNSARNSKSFKHKDKVFELLWRLANEYWTALSSGKGDAEARAVFGESYSAKESEIVSKNKRAKQLRTFTYNGQNIEMMKHLKIGVKPSTVETIRIHFEWFANERKIVIGHCGPHLDHK